MFGMEPLTCVCILLVACAAAIPAHLYYFVGITTSATSSLVGQPRVFLGWAVLIVATSSGAAGASIGMNSTIWLIVTFALAIGLAVMVAISLSTVVKVIINSIDAKSGEISSLKAAAVARDKEIEALKVALAKHQPEDNVHALATQPGKPKESR